MKYKRILALVLTLVLSLGMAIPASAAPILRKASDFSDFNASAWYAEAVAAAVDDGLLYGKSNTILDPDGNLTRAEMAAVINRAFGAYKTTDISAYKDVSPNAWYYKDIQKAVWMGTYEGQSANSMAPDASITRQEIMTVVARALYLDLDRFEETDLTKFADYRQISDWALPYVRAMVGAGYIQGRDTGLAAQASITRAEFAQLFFNIVSQYIIGGVVITKDNRFIKILEVLPVNFYLKSPNDQQNIIAAYASYLKIAPDSMTCEVRTLPADTSDYVEQMRQCHKNEPNEYCREEILDNIEQIGLGIASETIRHRFFLVFQYEAKMRAKRNTVRGIVQRLNEEADVARRYLDICELEVLEPRFTDDFVLKLLYDLINKATSLRVKLPEGVFDMTTSVHGVYE